VEGSGTDIDPDWLDFRWKVAAFISVQDAFDSPLFESKDTPMSMFYLWYFYCESRYLLTESIICGLNGTYVASKAVLRTFLEFNLLQLYFYNVSHETQSYAALDDFLANGVGPTWTTIIKKAVPDDAFCRPIRARLDVHLKALSGAAMHPYHPVHSPRQYSQSSGIPSLVGVYFWQTIRLVLQGVLWAYYVNFPALFAPRNLLDKFGFSPPVGVLVDWQCATVIKRSLTAEEYEDFRGYAQEDANLRGLLDWYEGFPSLTAEEIEATWNVKDEGPLNRPDHHAFGMVMAKMRTIREAMALRTFSPEDDDASEDMDFSSLNYDKWKRVYKSVQKRKPGK